MRFSTNNFLHAVIVGVLLCSTATTLQAVTPGQSDEQTPVADQTQAQDPHENEGTDDAKTPNSFAKKILIGTAIVGTIAAAIICFAYLKHTTNQESKGKTPAAGTAAPAAPVAPTPQAQMLNENCPFCLDRLQDGTPIRILPCRHGFHIACGGDQWLQGDTMTVDRETELAPGDIIRTRDEVHLGGRCPVCRQPAH